MSVENVLQAIRSRYYLRDIIRPPFSIFFLAFSLHLEYRGLYDVSKGSYDNSRIESDGISRKVAAYGFPYAGPQGNRLEKRNRYKLTDPV